jgi:hypothetical protein
MRMARLIAEKTDFLTRPATSLFGQALQEKLMSKKTYFEKLRDPRWQKKRLEAMQAKDFSCELCGDESSTLNVHHKTYFKGREPWEYELNQLSVLCETCHENEHNQEDILKIVFSTLPLDGPCNKNDVAFLVAGYSGFPFDELVNLLGYDHPVYKKIYQIGCNANDEFWKSVVWRND